MDRAERGADDTRRVSHLSGPNRARLLAWIRFIPGREYVFCERGKLFDYPTAERDDVGLILLVYVVHGSEYRRARAFQHVIGEQSAI